jgi:soluble lytic murein transglycosylase
VRQESQFSATARSSANAIGLSQVVPPTGREIARALGRSDYRTDDLVRPVVSVEFGMYYLADQLETYRGQIYPALAAYNAGGGPVNRWIREFGTEDVDLFAELVPYPETHHYIQVVYENYRLYRRLYAP